MQNDTSPLLANTPEDDSAVVPVRPKLGGQRVIQPTAEFVQEQKQQAQQPTAATNTPIPQAASGTDPNAGPLATPSPTPVATVPEQQRAAPGLARFDPLNPVQLPSQPGMAQGQGAIGQPTAGAKRKNLLVVVVVVLVAAVGILGLLFATGVLTTSRMKTVDYTSRDGVSYRLTFYSKYRMDETKSGSVQLVSKVSVDGKFPLTLTIATGSEGSYSKVENCSWATSLTKVFEVQNTSENQSVAVCNVSLGAGKPQGVYVAGITHGGQTSIITISQDFSSLDTSNLNAAANALSKFGLDPYEEDIKTIIASIDVQ